MTEQRGWVRRLIGALSVGAIVSATLVAMVATAPSAAAESVYVVNSTLDTTDTAPGDGVCATALLVCTLRAAIAEAKEGPNNVPVRINFNIPGSGVQTITLGSQLPDIGQWDPPMTIDGYTQPSASPNTDPLVSNAVLRIHVRGNSDTSGFIGIRISGDGNVVRGLAMTRLFVKIKLIHPSATGNVIAGNFIGTDPAGTYKASSRSTYANGIELYNGAHSNWIGEPTPEGRNVVSGNAGHGIAVYTAGADDNHIVNNIVGLNHIGTDDIANRVEGIDINRDASYNVIGGFGPYERNLVSGNATGGIEISHNSGTVGNMVLGNFVGTDKTGTRGLSYTANGNGGIKIEDGASQTVVDGNVIGNTSGARRNIQLLGSPGETTTGNVIRNNRIGVSLDGSFLGGTTGIRIVNLVEHTLIENNIIAGHSANGIEITSHNENDFNTITRNSIYANGGLGIDLQPWGVNPNDPGDSDGGPNQRLNFPEFTATTVRATGTACPNCTVEVFEADAPAGQYGEGSTFVASGTADGTGAFEVALASQVSPGDVITATATDPEGNSSEFSENVSVTQGPNESPVAVGTTTCISLTCSFDGSGSYDPDGSITSWSWNFGDGASAAGPVATHDYATEALYTATLIVTDDHGDPGAIAIEVLPTPDLPVTLASDGFARTVTGGWGVAELGGSYAYPGGQAAAFSVTDDVGRVALTSAGQSRRTWLEGEAATDVDVAVTVNFDRAPEGGYGQTVALQLRRVASNTAYRGRVRFAPDGTVRVAAVKLTGAGGEILIGSEVTVPGLLAEPGVDYRMRARVASTNPATIRVKVWRADQVEPTMWDVVRADSEPVLQTSGTVGLHAYAGSGTTSAVRFSFDDLVTNTTS